MQIKLTILKKLVFVLLAAFISSCTEQYIFQNQDFEQALVVEATITNELKNHEVKLSRTSEVNDTINQIEHGAEITITNSNGVVFNFQEKEGKYISEKEFKAEPDESYQLKITTTAGKSYISTTETLTTLNTIDLVPENVIRDGEKGVQINVVSFDPTNTSKYYRYKYEETYKIKTPYTIRERIELINPDGFIRNIVPAKPDTRICYSTNYSEEIIQTNSIDLNEDRINFPIRFIPASDYIVTNRYSIMVTQYTQSLNAYNYYSILKKMSDAGELLSPNQPGYIIGNVKSLRDVTEKVVGYFEVASATEKRIFFNYNDVFPSETPTEYFRNCKAELIRFIDFPNDNYVILKTHSYIGLGPGFIPFQYYMIENQCGDCTTFSSNIKPSFWKD